MALHAPAAEQAVLGGLMLDARAWDIVASRVGEEDFATGRHRTLFRVLRGLLDRGRPCDLLTLTDALEARNALDQVGGRVYLAELAHNTPSAANVATYADMMQDAANRRRLAAALAELQAAVAGTTPTDELLAEAVGRIEASRRQVGRGPTDWRRAVAAASEAAETAQGRQRAEGVQGVPTGIPAIDLRTGGLHGPRLWVMAGRPSLGKSALALQVAVLAAKHGHGAGIVSLEMSREELAQRAIAHHGGLNLTKLAHGYQPECSQAAAMAADRDFAGLPLQVDDDTYTLGGIVARIAEWRRQHGIALAIVDHIGLVETERFATRAEQVGSVSRALKKLAKRLEIPIVAISQLNRRVESEKRRPTLADLRDSGSIEQDADVCLFIHCAEPDEEQRVRPVELGLLKNRSGVRGWLSKRFEFDGATQTFRELTTDQGLGRNGTSADDYQAATDGDL